MQQGQRGSPGSQIHTNIQKMSIEESQFATMKRIIAQSQSMNNKIMLPSRDVIKLSIDDKRELISELIQLRGGMTRKCAEFSNLIKPLQDKVGNYLTKHLDMKETAEVKESMMNMSVKPIPQSETVTRSSHQGGGQTSLKNNKNRRSNGHRTNNPSTSQRSTGFAERSLNEESGHPLDIWSRSRFLFSDIPTEAEILNALRTPDTFPSYYYSKQEHWLDWVKRIIDGSKNPKQLVVPVANQSNPSDVSDEWLSIKLPFQIEKPQMENRHTFHYLLSALVDIPEKVETKECADDAFLPLHSLAPKLQYHDYLNNDFSTRLDLEIESIDLQKSSDNVQDTSYAFESEIRSMENEIAELTPKIIEIRNDVLRKLPDYLEMQTHRANQRGVFKALFDAIPPSSRQHRKKR